MKVKFIAYNRKDIIFIQHDYNYYQLDYCRKHEDKDFVNLLIKLNYLFFQIKDGEKQQFIEDLKKE